MSQVLKVVVAAAAMLAGASTIQAQADSLERIYGQGVHAYFDGQLTEAKVYFDRAVDSGSQDPRVFYYRGVVNSMLGDDRSAEADFTRGADLEMNSGAGAYPVHRSLQRVQGAVRLQIENARSAAAYVATARSRGGSGQRNRPNSNAARTFRPEEIDTSPRMQTQPEQINFPDVSGIESPTDLFSGEGEMIEVPEEILEPEVAAVETPAAAGSTANSGEAAPAAAEVAEPDPFGGDEKPAKEESDDDPFGGDDEEDPFGGEESKDEKEDESDDDPFGDG